MLFVKSTLIGFLIAVVVPGSGNSQAKPASPVTIVKSASPRQLQFDVDIPARIEEVWAAFSTREGMITWLAPDAKIDLRPGGDWLVMFPGAVPGGGKIEQSKRPAFVRSARQQLLR